MKTVLLIACICIVSAAADLVTLSQGFVEVFSITNEEAQFCINKMKLTQEDFKALQDQITEISEEQLLLQVNTRRAICTLTCLAQAQGTMVGAKLYTPKIHALIEQARGMPEPVRINAHENVDVCSQNVKDLTNECEVGLKFATCLIAKHREFHN